MPRPLIRHYFKDCSEPNIKGLDTLVNNAGGLAENITLEFIDWGIRTAKGVGELQPTMLAHIADLRAVAPLVGKHLVCHLSILDGCGELVRRGATTSWCLLFVGRSVCFRRAILSRNPYITARFTHALV